MKTQLLFATLGLSTFLGASNNPATNKELHAWLLNMHQRQIALLKINWGQSGLENTKPKTSLRKDHK